MELIEIAQIIKPQGIFGQVKAKHFSNNPEEFFEFETLYLKNNRDTIAYSIEETRVDATHVYLKLKGVDTRNDAEALRLQMLYVPKKELAKLPQGSYLVRDLTGINLVTKTGKKLGVLTNILQHGAVDVYVVKADKGFMFPALKRVVISTDISAKTMVLDETALKEVAVYDD